MPARFGIVRVVSILFALCFARATISQQKPLTRNFVLGAEERYQVHVAIRIETHGVSTEISSEKKAYTTFYTHVADGSVSWRSSRTIQSISPAGVASISESLDNFVAQCDKDSSSESFNAALQKSVQETCAAWQSTASFQYAEEKFGILRGLSPESSQASSDSSLLALWLRRALRPAVLLPQSPIQFGVRAGHKVGASSTSSSQPHGQESSEWLESSGDTPAAIWHVSQDLEWLSPHDNSFAKPGGKPSMRQFFYADSLNTVSLLDGSLLKATRSATSESKELLDPVTGLSEAPAFGSKLTITVTILRLP